MHSPEFIFGALSALAVRLVRIVAIAIFVTIAHPHIWYALAVGAFEFIFRARFLLAVGLVVAVRAFFETVASFAGVNTKCRLIRGCRALELLLEALVFVAIDFVAAIAALIFPVTNMRRTDALSIAALILTQFTSERPARSRLIAAIATIILTVATPEEWDAFFRCCAFELSRRTVGDARLIISGQVKLIGTFASVEWFNWRQ